MIRKNLFCFAFLVFIIITATACSRKETNTEQPNSIGNTSVTPKVNITPEVNTDKSAKVANETDPVEKEYVYIEPKLYDRLPEWDSIDVYDNAVQIEDFIIAPGMTVGEVFDRINASDIQYLVRCNTNALGNTSIWIETGNYELIKLSECDLGELIQPFYAYASTSDYVDQIQFYRAEPNGGKQTKRWFSITALNIPEKSEYAPDNDSLSIPISEAIVIAIDPIDCKQYSRYLNGDWLEDPFCKQWEVEELGLDYERLISLDIVEERVNMLRGYFKDIQIRGARPQFLTSLDQISDTTLLNDFQKKHNAHGSLHYMIVNYYGDNRSLVCFVTNSSGDIDLIGCFRIAVEEKDQGIFVDYYGRITNSLGMACRCQDYNYTYALRNQDASLFSGIYELKDTIQETLFDMVARDLTVIDISDESVLDYLHETDCFKISLD